MTSIESVQRAPRRTASKIQPVILDPASYPDLYCMVLDGACLEPLIPNGATVVLKKSAPFAVDDVVCVWWRPEILKPGSHPAVLKRVSLNAPPWVKFPYRDHPKSDVAAIMMLEQLNPPVNYTVRCEQILMVHKAIGYVLAGGKIGGTVKAADMLPIAKEVQS